jgi:iron complex outermembrane receptor protein
MSEFQRARPISRFVAAAISCSVTAAWAQQQAAPAIEARVSIAAQPLANALQRFSEQSGLQVGFESDIARDLQSHGTDGAQPAAQALAQLLEGTGLDYRFVNERTVVIRQGSAKARDGSTKSAEADAASINDTASVAPASTVLRLAQAEPAAPAAQGQDALEEVVVRGLNFKYNVVETANKMNLSIKDTPQSVKVITEDMLDFSGITKFEDAYKLDAGAHTSHGQDGFVRQYFRGFKLDSNNAIKLDGLRMPGLIVPDLSPFERFEIIKGSTSTIYGQSLVAGTLNAVSKKPRADFGGTAELEIGSRSHYRGELDVYGALTENEKLTSRLVASYLDEDTHIDYSWAKRMVVAPSLKYEFTPNTSLMLQTQVQNIEFVGSWGSGEQFIGGDPNDLSNYVIPDVPRSRLFGNPGANSDRDIFFTRLLLEHRFANEWLLRANSQYGDSEVKNYGNYAGVTDPDGFLQPLYMYLGQRTGESYAGEVNLFGDVELFGRTHQLFFGADYTRDKGTNYLGFGGMYGTFNVFDPDYSALPRYPRTVPEYTSDNIPGYDGIFFRSKDLYAEYGMTVQAILHPTDRLTFLLGGRYSNVEYSEARRCCDITSLDPLPAGYTADEVWDNEDWTFQGGMTFALTPDVNLYASYGQTFLPRNEFLQDPADPDGLGIPVGPEEGESFEIGFKGEAFERNVSWSAAAFEIARTNITESFGPDPRFVEFRGKQRARGIELDMQGEVLPGWDVYASVATLDNKFVGDSVFAGFKSYMGPKLGVSLFSSYEIQDGSLKGLGFGGGVVYKQLDDMPVYEELAPGQSRRYYDLLDDPVEVDARLFYRRGPWNYQLAVTNLFDSKYYSVEDNTFHYAVSVNPGRRVIGKMSYSF